MSDLTPKEFYIFLKENGINELYFFTTVRSACSMLHARELLSPYQLSYRGLPASVIGSEASYKVNNMWNKIPLYLDDLHPYYKNRNLLGPVYMGINVDFLLNIDEKDFRVSKKRPTKASKFEDKEDLFYSSIEEFANDYQNIIPGHRLQNVVVLIRDKRSHISLDKYLTSFYLDKLRTRHMLYKKANKALYAAVLELSHDARMNVRRCEDPACRCHDSYDKLNIDDAEKLFLP